MRLASPTHTSGISREIQPGVWLDSRLAVWLEPERLLVVADLHWGYSTAHRARGNLVPIWGDDVIRSRLESLLTTYHPAEMIWVGDIVHAAEGAASVEQFLKTATVPVTVLAGNHDRRWRYQTETTARRGHYFFHHGDVSREVPPGSIEVIGHHHPAVAWSDGAGGNLKLPALLASAERLVLPAFSPWASGTDCRPLITAKTTCWAIAPHRVFAVRSTSRCSAV